MRSLRFRQLFLVVALIPVFLILPWCWESVLGANSPRVSQAHKKPKLSAVMAAAQQYAEAVAGGDRIAAGRLDFACQLQMVRTNTKRRAAFPPDSDPIYSGCWEWLVSAHGSAVERHEQGLDVLWPGKDSLVFLGEDLKQYPPSVFVMDLLGLSPPAGGLRIEPLDSVRLPSASFRVREGDPVVAAVASLVRLRVTYKDPLTAPATYAPDAYKWANPVKRPRRALKAVMVRWVVLSGLRKLGFPNDLAVVNLPLTAADGTTIPFVTEVGGYQTDSGAWWEPSDAPGVLLAAVGRAVQLPEHRDRVALLNRVLIVDPNQPEALTALSRELYQALLAFGGRLHQIPVNDPALAARFNELYWTVQSQTDRLDISLGMQMGGRPEPTPADYLYRLIPVMERLAKVRPEDYENRLHLGMAYRWANDQLAAISAHEALAAAIPPEKAALRARVLTELAWSRIARVVWNRTFDDPGIVEAAREAEQALALSEQPLEKFTAAYTLAYSLAFTPNRDNRAMLERLTQAHQWYTQVAGASAGSWRYLLQNDTLKGVVETDPAFKPLVGAS